MMFATRVAPAYRINDIVSQVRFQVRFLVFAHVLLISLAQSKMCSNLWLVDMFEKKTAQLAS